MPRKLRTVLLALTALLSPVAHADQAADLAGAFLAKERLFEAGTVAVCRERETRKAARVAAGEEGEPVMDTHVYRDAEIHELAQQIRKQTGRRADPRCTGPVHVAWAQLEPDLAAAAERAALRLLHGERAQRLVAALSKGVSKAAVQEAQRSAKEAAIALQAAIDGEVERVRTYLPKHPAQ
jgi:hypothetical protein